MDDDATEPPTSPLPKVHRWDALLQEDSATTDGHRRWRLALETGLVDKASSIVAPGWRLVRTYEEGSTTVFEFEGDGEAADD